MQTFLPDASFVRCAEILDNKRLGKQRVECKQILLALGVQVGLHMPNPKSRWRNHPAVRMWAGHELQLLNYAICICSEWRRRGFDDSLLMQFGIAEFVRRTRYLPADLSAAMELPPWIADSRLHASHRSNLLRKDPVHYGKFGWTEPPTIPYHWPV